MIEDIVKTAISEKILELKALKDILDKEAEGIRNALVLKERDIKVTKKQIETLKDYLKEAEGPFPEQEETVEEKSEDMTVEEMKVKQHLKYLRRKDKKKAAALEENKPSESIEEINAKAKAAGLSYGKYLAQRDIERQHEEMEEARRKRKLAGGVKDDSEGVSGTNQES